MSSTLGTGRPAPPSPPGRWVLLWGTLDVQPWPTVGPDRKEDRALVCSCGAKGVLDSQQGCNPVYVFGIYIYPKSGQFKRRCFHLVEMSFTFYMRSESNICRALCSPQCCDSLWRKADLSWIPDSQFVSCKTGANSLSSVPQFLLRGAGSFCETLFQSTEHRAGHVVNTP